MTKSVTTKIGRSAITGLFIPIKQAEQHPRTTIVQTVTKPASRPVTKSK